MVVAITDHKSSTVDQTLIIYSIALPEGVPLSTIYKDFFGYLARHTQEAFANRVLDGTRVWHTYFPSADVVLAHPNGWGLREQEFMRGAAVAAGIVPQEEAHSRIFFVTEGEASVHYCMLHANLAPQFRVRARLLCHDNVDRYVFLR